MRTEDFRPAIPDGFATKLLSDALREPNFADELVNWYLGVFNAKGADEWGERWTPETAHRKLIGDTAGEHERTLVTTWRVNGVLAGALLLSVDRVDRSLRIQDLPSGSQRAEVLTDVMRHLTWLVGADARIAQFRELGIRKEYRLGWLPLAKILSLSGQAAADRLGAVFHVFWTSKSRRLYPIMSGLDSRIIFDFRDAEENVLMGDGIVSTLRRLAEPPEMAEEMIAARLEHSGALLHYSGSGVWKLVAAATRVGRLTRNAKKILLTSSLGRLFGFGGQGGI